MSLLQRPTLENRLSRWIQRRANIATLFRSSAPQTQASRPERPPAATKAHIPGAATQHSPFRDVTFETEKVNFEIENQVQMASEPVGLPAQSNTDVAGSRPETAAEQPQKSDSN